MADAEKKGLTVKIDADLHAEVRQYLDAHEMTMAEFVTLALQDELHPKNNMKEGNTMEKTRTLAFQIPEELYLRIKDYLQRNNMTQRQFVIGLIEDEFLREQDELESQAEAVSDEKNSMRDEPGEEVKNAVSDGFEPVSAAYDKPPDQDETENEPDEVPDESEDGDQGFSMTM